MSDKKPSFQFYPGDWMKDPAVRQCSLAARGLWIEMLLLMFESSRRGYLQQANGTPTSPEQLARMTGCDRDEAAHLLQELDDAGVFSRTDNGTVYSRRMTRDERKRTLCSEAGKRGGGNPAFKGHDKGGYKGEGQRSAKASSSSSASPSKIYSARTSSSAGTVNKQKPFDPCVPKPNSEPPINSDELTRWKKLRDSGEKLPAHIAFALDQLDRKTTMVGSA